jgi:acyl-CoA synthetase (AMP-forming)/AMP-acid ligase II
VLDGNTTIEDVDAWCRSMLAGYKRPRAIKAIPTIERLGSQKVDYEFARQAFLESR